MTYAILISPGHNRVYFENALKLSVSEFNIVARRLSVGVSDIARQSIAGISHLTFQTDGKLSIQDTKIVSDLSFAYALYQVEQIDGETCLRPLQKQREDFVDEGIGAMLKYSGKTNEIFTRMMINIAVYSQSVTENLKLLDPVAGKGTTLYEGLVKGHSVYGIEIADSVVNESYHFLKRFLETARYKFEHTSIKMSGENKSFTSLRHTFETAKTKEAFKAKNTKTIELIAGNSCYANKYYKKNFFDICVGDLPYGVQHHNVTNEKQSSSTRNPAELLTACLPSWAEVLKPGGVIALAWNLNVLPRKKIEQIFENSGLSVKNDSDYLQFSHRVDQSITRDIIVARK